MPSFEETKDLIYSEITGEEKAAAASFLARYGEQAARFSDLTAQAIMDWEAIDRGAVQSENRKHKRIAFLIFCAITLNAQSMKLLLAGHIVAAGNLMRQTIEALALSLLGSGKSLTLLDQFDAGKYSTNVAVRDVLRNRKALGLDEHGVKSLEIAKNFYHNHSHFSRLTVATVIAFEEVGLYVGASFDEAKVDQYDSEVASRVQLAEVLPSFIEAVTTNIAKW